MLEKLALMIAIVLCMSIFISCDYEKAEAQATSGEFLELTEDLLLEWTDAMVDLQIINPDDSTIHGGLRCPASDKIHGRCMDAVYPCMYMADKTGEQKYLDAALNVMKWSENVSQSDGSWDGYA